MKCMNRNKTSFYYALYLGKTPIVDEYGNETSESAVSYGNPVKYNANISPARGETATRQFGDSVNYDRVICIDDVEIPLTENSILWVDRTPTIAQDGSTETPHDYVVRKIAYSLNNVLLAISKVDVDA